MSLPRKYPHDLECERALLSLALLDTQETLAVCEGVVVESDFYAPAHSAMWQAFVALGKHTSRVDTVLLESQLKLAGKLELCAEAIGAVTAKIPQGDAHAYGLRIQKLAMSRAVMRSCLELLSAGERIEDVDAYLDLAESAFKAACARRMTASVVPIADALHESYADLMRRQSEGGGLKGYATGLHALDTGLSGLCPGNLIVLGGRPSMGKSALAARMLIGAVRSSGKPALVLSLEMSAVQIATRMLASEANVSLGRIRNARVSQQELEELAHFADAMSRLPVYFLDDSELQLADLRREAKRLARSKGELGLLVVDYLQLMRPSKRGEKRETEVAEISRSLKSIAKELGCPVLALSQLNRSLESRSDKRPTLADLRESGAIEQDADDVLFIYRDEHYNPKSPDRGIAEVIVAKQRSGGTGVIKLAWTDNVTRFDNLDRHQQEEFGYES